VNVAVSVATANSTQDLWQLTEAQKKQIKESWTSVLTKEKQNPNPAQRGSSLFFELRAVAILQTLTKNSNFVTDFISNVCSTFYEILFRRHPNIKSMFEDKGLQAQARALMQMMNVLVKSIDNTSKLVPLLKKLGSLFLSTTRFLFTFWSLLTSVVVFILCGSGGHHLIYGVEVPHYQVFGVVLVETFEAILGKETVSETHLSLKRSMT
jgi:hemoglobin-like flavoprotein